MNKIIWKAITKTGQLKLQQNNGIYTNFMDLDRQTLISFNLFNKSNNANYGIDLMSGYFMFNGMSVMPAIQNGVYDVPCMPKERFDYRKTLFWYKQFTAGLNTANTATQCINVFAGYTVQLDQQAVINNKVGRIILARPCIKINAKNNLCSLSVSYVFEYKDENGNIIKVQG